MKVLVVVDMIKAFALRGLEENSLFFDDAEKIIPFVVAKVNEYLEKGWYIIFLGDNHDYNDMEFARFSRHAVANSLSAELIDELKHALMGKNVIYIPKTRYSGFFRTDLNQYIKAQELEKATFEFVGVCTGICNTDTIGDFANRDMKTAIYRDGVADLPNVAYGIEDCSMPMNDIMLARMAFVYGTEII